MENKIKNCGLCGGEARVVGETGWKEGVKIGDKVRINFWFVECSKCGLRAPRSGSADEAISVWNNIQRAINFLKIKICPDILENEEKKA